MLICPLCHGQTAEEFHRDRSRAYFRCPLCRLIFADPSSRLSPAEERRRYEQHENDPQDPRYREFLSRLVEPLAERLGQPPQEGLDFGCGPGPTLSLMMQERGHRMAVYDPFFAPDAATLTRTYNFITCTETFEHFHTPHREWALLSGLLRPGGWLGIMTKLARDRDSFAQWHYIRDPTHVSFFSRATFRYLAERDRLQLEFVGDDVILMKKSV